MTEPLLPLVVGHETSKAVWDALARAFGSRSRSRVLQLRTRLHGICCGTVSVGEYVQSIKTIADELAAIGHPMDEDDFVMVVLAGL